MDREFVKARIIANALVDPRSLDQQGSLSTRADKDSSLPPYASILYLLPFEAPRTADMTDF
jgi:hypothetical protein